MESLKQRMDKYALDILNTEGHVDKQRLDDFLNGANFVIRKIECALAQCESARNLDDIRQELSGIKHELNMMRNK